MNYTDYTSLGFDLVSEGEFEKYHREAKLFLNYYTQGRCEKDILICELMDIYKARDVDVEKHGRVASESVLDHSVSYKDTTPETLSKEYTKKVVSVIRQHCWQDGGVYRGI